MEQRNKAAEERSYVQLLCEHVSTLSGARLESLAPPEPDVLVEVGGKRFGVEVTEIHGDPRLRMIEGEQNKILVGAQREWERRSLPAVAVWVHWVPTRLPRRLSRDLPIRLVDFLAARLPAHPGDLEMDQPEIQTQLGTDCGIEHVFLYTDSEAPSAWELGRRWEGGMAGPPLIQREIDRKNAKPAQYTDTYDERWLVLVHNGANPSSGFDLGPDILRSSYTSTFDRVYLLALLGPKVWDLNLSS